MWKLNNNEDIVSHWKPLQKESDQKKQASWAAIRLDYNMADKQTTKVLKDLNLEYLLPRFLQECITLDIINKLSINELRKLGLLNRSQVIKLRKKFNVYGSYCSQRVAGNGGPKFDITD